MIQSPPKTDHTSLIAREKTSGISWIFYLRTGRLILPPDAGELLLEELLEEAEFYQIRGIVEELRHRPNLPFKDSTILSTEQKQVFVNKWLKEKMKSSQSDFVMAYRASRNGWNSSNFHSLCDNKGPTFTVVKSGNYIFGGFTEQSWDGKHCTLVLW